MTHEVIISSWLDKSTNFTDFDYKQKSKTDAADIDDLIIVSHTINSVLYLTHLARIFLQLKI